MSDENLLIHVTSKEHAAIERAARVAGMSVCQWCRLALLKAAVGEILMAAREQGRVDCCEHGLRKDAYCPECGFNQGWC